MYAGETIRISNTHGKQVVSMWALSSRGTLPDLPQSDPSATGKGQASGSDGSSLPDYSDTSSLRSVFGDFDDLPTPARKATTSPPVTKSAANAAIRAKTPVNRSSAGREAAAAAASAPGPSAPGPSGCSHFTYHRDPDYAPFCSRYCASRLFALSKERLAMKAFIKPTAYKPPAVANAAAKAPRDYLSMSHTRTKLGKLIPGLDDCLVDQKHVPMLKLVADTTDGTHDTLSAACDRWQYRELGATEPHRSCADNYWHALHKIIKLERKRQFREHFGKWKKPQEDRELLATFESFLDANFFTPDPFHIFMNAPIMHGDRINQATLKYLPSRAGVGECVCFEALRNCVVVLSACPQDRLATNNDVPTPVHFEVMDKVSFATLRALAGF